MSGTTEKVAANIYAVLSIINIQKCTIEDYLRPEYLFLSSQYCAIVAVALWRSSGVEQP